MSYQTGSQVFTHGYRLPGGLLLRYGLALAGLIAALVVHFQVASDLSLADQLSLIVGQAPTDFSQVHFYHGLLPRALLAVLVGGAMALVGSLLQQMTQNPLLAPMTIGASSGAWLALVCATVWAPVLAASHGAWFAMGGAMVAVVLVLAVAGRNGIGGLAVVLAGMAVHMLFGAIASAVLLLNEGAASNLFIWGAGDLTQTGWHWVDWLWPKLGLILIILLLAPRPLTLLRLGQAGAQARGLNSAPVMLALLVAALWLVASSVTAVGIISFIGLITPNIARSAGARGSLDELLFSLLLGAVLLVATDALAVAASSWTVNLVPSGTAAALVGAPALIWFARRKLGSRDSTELALPRGARQVTPAIRVLVPVSLILLVVLSLTFLPENFALHAPFQALAWPSDLILSLRWPRVLAAASAGAGMALAGLLLQRLIRNPLASPDILGMSAGSTLALVVYVMLVGGSIHEAGPLVAFLGSGLVLAVLLLLGRRNHFAPGILILVGIALAALIEALVHFVLARGAEDVYALIGWLAGSTYRVSPGQALLLTGGNLVLFALSLMLTPWLTLISAGDDIALGRGLNVPRARLLLLLLACAFCALVTAVVGPLAFVGLLAPHLATLMGAHKVWPQLWLAPLTGAALMLASDFLGQTLFYPGQMPAGTVAAILGGGYFMYLLTRRKLA